MFDEFQNMYFFNTASMSYGCRKVKAVISPMKGVWLLPVVATPLALIIFIQGFLPLKVHNEGFASEQCCDKPVFKKVVLMVVDALKAEFMIKQDSVSADWAFVKKSVADGKAIMFKAKAHPPTVTLPRIKVC